MTAKTNNYFHKEKFNEKNAFIFGSEKRGLRNNILKLCDNTLKIEMSNKVESLNVSNSVSACLYALKILNNS